MVKRKERGGRRQILQLHEEKKPTIVQQHLLAQIGYSDSSEESDEEGASRDSQDSNNKGKDVIDEQVADFLKEIDAIATPAEDAAEQKTETNDEGVAETSTSATSVPVAADPAVRDDKETNGVDSKEDELTCAWQQCRDESTGYAYYWNVETNEVTWECPAEYFAYWTKLNEAALAAHAQQGANTTAESVTSSAGSTVQTKPRKEEPCEGKIIPITSYGSSDESSDEDELSVQRATQARTKPSRSRRLDTGSGPCEYGPQLPPGMQLPVSPPASPVVQGCQPPPADESVDEQGSSLHPEEVVYGPQLPSQAGSEEDACSDANVFGPQLPSSYTEAGYDGESSVACAWGPQGEDDCAVESTGTYGPHLPLEDSREPVLETAERPAEYGSQLPQNGEGLVEMDDENVPTDSPSLLSASDLGADLPEPSQAAGVMLAPGSLIDYPSSPANEDEEDDNTALSTSSASSAVMDYPVMVGSHMRFGPSTDERRVESSGADETEPDSTTRVVPGKRARSSADDVGSSSSAQASLLVSYGESDSEDDASADTSAPVTVSSHSAEADSPGRQPASTEAEKYSLCDATSTTFADKRGGDRQGIGFSRLGGSESASKILARKKRLMSVKFVKSDEVLYLSEATAPDDGTSSDKEEDTRPPEPTNVREDEDSDDDFDDVLQALDDALMESKKKAARESNTKADAMGTSRQEKVDSEPADTASSGGTASPGPQEDMMIDSPTETEPVIKIGGMDYVDEIESLLAVVMAKLVHFSAVNHLDDNIRDLAVQVQTRTQDWRAGALDPKYCWTKLQEANDMLQLREASMTLPRGWSCHWDSGTMRYFYTDDATGRSQWEFPTEVHSPRDAFEEEYGPQQLSTVTSSTVEQPTVPSAAAILMPSSSDSRGEKRKASSSIEPAVEENHLADGAAASYSHVVQPLADTAPIEDTSAPPGEQADNEQLPSRSADESAPSTSKRKKTKLSSGLALRKKNIPSLLQKWEKIKKEQLKEDL